MGRAVTDRACPNAQCAMWGKRLTFRDVLTAAGALLSFVAALIGVIWRRQALALRLAAARSHIVKEAPNIEQRVRRQMMATTMTAHGRVRVRTWVVMGAL